MIRLDWTDLGPSIVTLIVRLTNWRWTYNFYCLDFIPSYPERIMSYSPPPLAYVPMVIPYPSAPGAPFFDGQNITDFLDRYSQLCSNYRLSEAEKI